MKRKYQVTIAGLSKHFIAKCMIFSLLMISIVSCKKDDDTSTTTELVGNWIKLSDFEGKPRYDAVAFTINGKAYVGTGYDGDDYLSDFWEYDPAKDTWTKKDSFPGAPRSGAVAFSIGSKGYVGTGYDGIKKLNDFYVYDPATNEWDTIANFGGTERYAAIAFSIGNKGYVGTGYDGYYLKDFWEYDPTTDAWTQKVSVGGSKRKDAVGFVIGDKGYVCTGVVNGIYEDDIWEYDPTNDTWTEKRSISNITNETYDDYYTTITGISKVAFSIGGKGYLATGGQGTVGKIVWEYTPGLPPSGDIWIQKSSFEGADRTDGVSFTIGERAYVTTGRSSSYYFDDIWGFDPNAVYNATSK